MKVPVGNLGEWATVHSGKVDLVFLTQSPYLNLAGSQRGEWCGSMERPGASRLSFVHE
jgi:hypothetical protein